MSQAALTICGLRVAVGSGSSVAFPVDGVSIRVARGECVGLVGESGAGKSLTLRAAIGLLPAGVRIHDGEIVLGGRTRSESDAHRGAIGMIFQEPGASLNPLMRVGGLIAEGLRVRGLRGAEARRRVIELLGEVGMSDPELRSRSWPHELSGGQRQRVAIAMALAGEPSVLLCDEPTTALDVTVQERILELLDRLRAERELAIVLVTHDLAVIGRISHRLAVMYAGRIIEAGPSSEILGGPRHPYTARLLACSPRLERAGRELLSIPGDAPDPHSYPSGCRFHPRCAHVREDCASVSPTLSESGPDRQSACIHWSELEPVLERESM